jgi:2-dehydro-3-deoxyphosphogluconate aldolase/(4S)-4-hydroxy-2-oxoglutarate aldolase
LDTPKVLSEHPSVAAMLASGAVPVYNGPDPQLAWQLLRLCQDAGIGVFEWTARDPRALGVFSQLSQRAQIEGLDVVLGAGSITDSKRAEAYLQAGARFIVGPALVESLAAFCQSKDVPYIPGCATPTEIVRARDLGCGLIKVFPAGQLGGPAFLKAILAPLGNLKLMPTGGVDSSPENLKAWFDAGAACVGLGSQLFPQAELDQGAYPALGKRLQAVKAYIDQIRGEAA